MSTYKRISDNIEKLTIKNPEEKDFHWFNIKNPAKKELEYLRKNYGFKLRQLEWASAKAVSSRPIIEEDDGYMFLILQFPIYVKDKICVEEISFFIGEDYIITLHNNNIKKLNNFFNTCKKDKKEATNRELNRPLDLLFELIRKLINHCYSLIDQNSKAIDKIRETIFADYQKQATSKILYLRLNIISIRKIMQNHKNTLKKMMNMDNDLVRGEEAAKGFRSLIEHSKRIWEFSENQKEVIEALYDTNASLLNHRINETIKTLTIFSVSVLPIALVSSIFGTNLTNGMPLVNMEHGFWIALSIMVVGTLLMLLFFIKKKWL
jgi:magnesium transporter